MPSLSSTSNLDKRIKHNMMTKEPINQIGIVIETAENACKVMFSNRNNEVRNFMKSSLEVVSG